VLHTYRSYSCCRYAKIGDFAGGPDLLSCFASSDQLSHLNNCFDLLSFSFPRWTRYDVVAFTAPLSLSLSHNVLFRLFKSLFTSAHRCAVVPSIVSVPRILILFTYYIPQCFPHVTCSVPHYLPAVVRTVAPRSLCPFFIYYHLPVE